VERCVVASILERTVEAIFVHDRERDADPIFESVLVSDQGVAENARLAGARAEPGEARTVEAISVGISERMVGVVSPARWAAPLL
jgi:hypothetical protein